MNVRALLRVAKVAAASDPYDCIQPKFIIPIAIYPVSVESAA